MTGRWRGIWLAVAAVAGLQTAALAWMVGTRVVLLESGREVILPVVPVDPRSLFRGDYVRLGYDISRVPGRLLEGAVRRGEPLFVTIERSAQGSYAPVKVSRAFPGEPGGDRVVLRGRAERGRAAASGLQDLFVRYGIESYFVPEGEGLRLEELARGKKLAAVVAVDRSGNAAIKGLLIDGRLAVVEPLI